jgi:ribosome modulation factor
MRFNRIAIPALALLLGVAGLASTRSYAAASGSSADDRDRNWEAPPQELNEIQRRGFHDGIEAARKDFENHRQPNVENRDEYRHPEVSHELRDAYRAGFRRGYNASMSHLNETPTPVVVETPQRSVSIGGWEAVGGRYSEIERRGYQNGMDGARKDAGNDRRPDPNNRDEYRNPQVRPDLVEEYRKGFRRGYEEVVSQREGMPDRGSWDAAPGRFSQIQRRGFQDGMDGARKDVENNRRPDPNNRDEYRNPNVPPQLVEDYREGFRRGYERAIAHVTGNTDRR